MACHECEQLELAIEALAEELKHKDNIIRIYRTMKQQLSARLNERAQESDEYFELLCGEIDPGDEDDSKPIYTYSEIIRNPEALSADALAD